MGNVLKKPSFKPEKNQEEIDEAETVFFDCQLCLNPLSPTKKFNNEKDCSHIFCKDCIAKYIDSKIERNIAKITCPGMNCEMPLDPISCQPIIPDGLYQRWLDLLCYSAIAGLQKCYCPDKNCMALIVNECGGSVKNSKCPKCKKWYCFQCRTPWHDGRQCDQTRREMISLNDMLFMELTVGEKRLASCPNCHMYVELVADRGHCIVRCRCRTMFCFHCGRNCSKLSCDCPEFKKEMDQCKRDTMYNVLLPVAVICVGMFIWFWHRMLSCLISIDECKLGFLS